MYPEARKEKILTDQLPLFLKDLLPPEGFQMYLEARKRLMDRSSTASNSRSKFKSKSAEINDPSKDITVWIVYVLLLYFNIVHIYIDALNTDIWPCLDNISERLLRPSCSSFTMKKNNWLAHEDKRAYSNFGIPILFVSLDCREIMLLIDYTQATQLRVAVATQSRQFIKLAIHFLQELRSFRCHFPLTWNRVLTNPPKNQNLKKPPFITWWQRTQYLVVLTPWHHLGIGVRIASRKGDSMNTLQPKFTCTLSYDYSC